MIPLSRPSIGQDEVDAVSRVLRSGWLAHGSEVEAFEREFANYIGVRHAVALNSCASALQLALVAAGVRGEVITPSFTFVATANAILASGCSPVFADIDEKTCNLDPAAIEAQITARTRAVMPVHFAGQCCRMDEIMAVARYHNLLVIEDSAEAIGATYAGRMAGSFGIGCFSFYPTKNITTGEGGMIAADDGELAARVRALRNHGIRKDDVTHQQWPSWHRVATLQGYNYRLTNFQAALGRVQLARLDRMNAARRSHARYLNRNLRLSGIRLPEETGGCQHVFQMYTIRLDLDRYDRNQFVRTLTELGIGATVHFDPPLHLQPCYANATPARCPLPVTEQVARTIVTLPMYPDLSELELDRIIQAVHTAAEEALRRLQKRAAATHGRPSHYQSPDKVGFP
jgi:perosamine synthetase